jgi:hypothetical protein
VKSVVLHQLRVESNGSRDQFQKFGARRRKALWGVRNSECVCLLLFIRHHNLWFSVGYCFGLVAFRIHCVAGCVWHRFHDASTRIACANGHLVRSAGVRAMVVDSSSSPVGLHRQASHPPHCCRTFRMMATCCPLSPLPFLLLQDWI